MSKIVERHSFLGNREITCYEKENQEGEYSFIDGEWIWIKQEAV